MTPTPELRFVERTVVIPASNDHAAPAPEHKRVQRILQQEWDQRNNWAWFGLEWQDVPVVLDEEPIV